ncbi:sensor histidine kinase [Nocardioides gilvus]|uniref:sensor histidine kinase n=1 Tax=Nocardioides gilvus TaxID=1735589 RepID=UPI000D7489A5|nr:histidine kinase [Nocardioides gilvus]
MSATTARRGGLLSWGLSSDVQRMELYTRGSLRGLLAFLLLMGGLAAASEAERVLDFVLVGALALVLMVAGDRCLVAFMDLYPQAGPLPTARLAAVAAVLVPLGIVVVVSRSDPWAEMGFLLTVGAAWAFGGSRNWWVSGASVPYGAVVMGATADGWVWGWALYGAGASGFFVFTVHSSLWVLRIVHELDAARRTQADLAVAEERLRFSRDVHDVMGRHLSTIAVQAELAATLAERGDARAPERIREVRATAHEALREARSLARGYRPLDLAQELEGAVSLLASAGIDARADLDGLDERWAEPVARVVREGVTNVLRHSSATCVRVTHSDAVVEIRNDGVDPGLVPASDGSGLATLRADLEARGARLTHGAEGEEYVVRVHLAADSTDPATDSTDSATSSTAKLPVHAHLQEGS